MGSYGLTFDEPAPRNRLRALALRLGHWLQRLGRRVSVWALTQEGER